MRSLAIVVCLALSGQALAATAAPEMVKGPVKMKPSEIRAYNAALAPSDPACIVCLKSAPTGSLVTRTTCRTRAEWERLATIGNDDAVAWVSYARTHQFGINEEPAGSVGPAIGGPNN